MQLPFHTYYLLFVGFSLFCTGVICVFNWLTYQEARRQNSRNVLVWLLPLCINSTLLFTFNAWLLLQLTVRSLSTRNFYYIDFVWQSFSYLASVMAAVKLWEAIHRFSKQTSQAAKSPTERADPGVWPPPPER